MITASTFTVNLNEVLGLILNIRPDAPSFLIDTCCRFLKDYIDYYPEKYDISCYSWIGMDSLYRWMARVPGPAIRTIFYEDESKKERLFNIIADFDVIVNISSF
ncbi:hypothetical protein RF11_07972 [Thelohanellus kitauei]|uniref:Uncharacterized protein n=1 Tax=Thelohanellus kitauei TaxID=669202 RepID=A0A0C2JQU0_THEKT|nr:hypothetical protein RF11_07972 [Thelohanellus kitauei]